MILTYGRIAYEALRAAANLLPRCPVRVIRLGKLYPLDTHSLLSAIGDARRCLIVEEGMRRGGIGEMIAAMCAEGKPAIRVKILAVRNFVPHGDVNSLTADLGLDADSITKAAEF